MSQLCFDFQSERIAQTIRMAQNLNPNIEVLAHPSYTLGIHFLACHVGAEIDEHPEIVLKASRSNLRFALSSNMFQISGLVNFPSPSELQTHSGGICALHYIPNVLQT